MTAINKDFVVKNGLQVGGLTTLGPAASAGSIAFPSTGSDASSPSAGQVWRNATALKIYTGSATKTIAYTDSTMTGTWSGSVISPTYGGTGTNNGSSTITIGGNVTFSGAYTTTFTVGGNTALTLPASGTVAVLGDKLSAFAATSSSELAGVITDETGSGALVFATSPTFSTSIDSGATFAAFASATALTIGGSSNAQTISIGNASTGTSTYSIANGATTSGDTKTVSIGTGGLAGSTTNIYIGSATGTSTTTINQDLVVGGNLTVEGTTTTIDSTTLAVTDKNIEMAVPVSPASPTDVGADGGGIIVKGNTDHSLLWYNDNPTYWQVNDNLDLVGGSAFSINNIEVLSSSALTLDNVLLSASSAVSVSSGSSTVVVSISDSYRAAKVVMTLQQNDGVSDDFMTTELLVIHDGVNAYATEYGRIQTGSIIDATISADMGVNVVEISVTSTSASGSHPVYVRSSYTAMY